MNADQKHQYVHRSRRVMMFNNFLGGIAWGVGSVIGATIVISILASLIVYFRDVPYVGEVIESIDQDIESVSE
jgi:chromate transport protein ChrA